MSVSSASLDVHVADSIENKLESILNVAHSRVGLYVTNVRVSSRLSIETLCILLFLKNDECSVKHFVPSCVTHVNAIDGPALFAAIGDAMTRLTPQVRVARL